MRATINSLVAVAYMVVAVLYVMADHAALSAIWAAGAGIWLGLAIQAIMAE